MASYYRIINGKRYDRALLDLADRLLQGQGDGRISTADMQLIYETGLDAGHLTQIEAATLHLIRDRYPCTDAARTWLAQQSLPAASPAEAIDRIVLDHLGYIQLDIDIDATELASQSAPTQAVGFEEALIKALTLWREPRRYRGVIPTNFVFNILGEASELDLVSAGIDNFSQGQLYLVPQKTDHLAPGDFPYPLPRGEADTTNFWIFGLQSEDQPEYELFAYVHRHLPQLYYGKVFITGDMPLEQRLHTVIDEVLDIENLNLQIPTAEVMRQEERYGSRLEFEAVLYYALRLGMSNGESSTSFRDLASQEDWIDYDNFHDGFLFVLNRYLSEGTLHLLPTNWADTDLPYPLPTWFEGNLDWAWYFVFEAPSITHHRFLLSVPRHVDDLEAIAWSEGYTSTDLGDTATQIDKVLRHEFGLTALDIQVDPDELDRQHVAYDPFWRTPVSVMRQLCNTFTRDLNTDGSLLSFVIHTQAEHFLDADLDAEDTLSLLTAQTLAILNNGVLHLLPEDIYERPEDKLGDLIPPDADEAVAESYLFQLTLPQFDDATFFAVIPRYPGLENPSYNYLAGTADQDDNDEEE